MAEPDRGGLGRGGGSINDGPEGIVVGQVGEDGVRLMRGELDDGVSAGGHGQGAGPDGATARDIVRRIADDPNGFRQESTPNVGGGAPHRVRPEFIALFAVVGESAEGEKIPEIVMTKLNLSTSFNVAGEDSLGEEGATGGCRQQGTDTREDDGAWIDQRGGEIREVSVETALDVFLGKRHAEFFKDAADDPRIGSSGKINIIE